MFFIVVIILFLSFKCNHCNNEWQKLIQRFNEFEVSHVSNNILIFESIINETKVEKKCFKAIEEIFRDLKLLNSRAYQLYDSWPTFPPKAILEGTVVDFGDYDQCLSLSNVNYCLVDVKIPLPEKKTIHVNVNQKIEDLWSEEEEDQDTFFKKLSLNAIFFRLFVIRFGLCFPQECEERDIELISKTAFKETNVIVEKIDCKTRNNLNLNFVQWIAISILIMVLIISLFASVMNTKCLRMFNMKENIWKLFSCESKPQLSCIDGIRVLTMIYIITAHVIEYTDWSLYKDTFNIKKMMNDPVNIPITKVHTVVETFFLISGLLASFTTLKQTKGDFKNFQKFSYICQRVTRLLPLMAIFILLTTLLPLTNNGPVWNQHFQTRILPCYTKWWQNLLFIHNFIDPYHMCIGTTWFLSVDMQFHLLSFIVIIYLLKNRNQGLAINSMIIFLSIFITSSIIYLMDFSPGRVSTQFGPYFMNEFLTYIYWQPWSHAPVYFIGLRLGTLLYKMKVIKLTKTKQRIIWFLITFGYFITIYDTFYWTTGAPNNRWISALLFPTIRILWSVCTSALIWLCVSGNGGLVNRFLSWTGFTCLSRITYSVYLTHIWIVWSFWASRRQPLPTYPSTIWGLVCGTLFYSYLLGFGFSLLFEFPINHFQSYLKKHFFMIKSFKNIDII